MRVIQSQGQGLWQYLYLCSRYSWQWLWSEGFGYSAAMLRKGRKRWLGLWRPLWPKERLLKGQNWSRDALQRQLLRRGSVTVRTQRKLKLTRLVRKIENAYT